MKLKYVFYAAASMAVAPARERGLKSFIQEVVDFIDSRSREGAWIEIASCKAGIYRLFSRSREGAWIEIPTLERLWPYGFVAPARERGLKLLRLHKNRLILVAPARERGLKSTCWISIGRLLLSLPRGSVD